MKLRHLTTSAMALIVMSACTDSTGLEVDDLTGTWTASSIVFTSTADATVSADLVADEGTYIVTGSTLTLSQTGEGSPEAFTISRDGDSMTLTVTDEEFDFDTTDDN